MVIEKDCDKINFSSNINEVMRPALFLFMIKLQIQKAPKSTKKH